MEYFLSSSLIILGSFTAFLAAILSSLTHERLEELLLKNTKKSEQLQHMKLHHDSTNSSYYIVEMLLYVTSALVFGSYLGSQSIEWYLLLTEVLAFFILTVLLRTLMFAIGTRVADKTAYELTSYLQLFYAISKPFVNILESIKSKVGGKTLEEASRDEINALVESAREEGSLDDDEYRILKNIMHFSEILVSDVMTPRTVVFSCKSNMNVADVVLKPELRLFSRFPIWEGESLDDGVTGYVMSRDVLDAALKGQHDKKLKELAREVYIIPENAELDIALDRFLQRRQHLFVVVDEYGGIEGLLTMEDVLETMLGVEIVDEADKVINLRQLAKQHRDKRISQLRLD